MIHKLAFNLNLIIENSDWLEETAMSFTKGFQVM
jgi:hypothetical protein